MSSTAQAFYGTIVHSLSPSHLEILPDTLLIISPTGTIQSVHPSIKNSDIISFLAKHNYTSATCTVTTLRPTEFLCPGFIDTHIHAPQWAQRGMGRGIALLDWLENITFPHEAKFSDPAYARRMYSLCVSACLKQGTTTACYYGSRHPEASVILAETCIELGQRALIGKTCMNRNAPEWYRDSSAEQSIADTRAVIAQIRSLDAKYDARGGMVTPVITPRFAISCDAELLSGLGALAAENKDLPIQTHFNESREEVRFTQELFPPARTEAELYEGFGLLNERSILAHSIYLEESEMKRVQELGCGIAHCPIPNTTMDAFMIAPVREYLRRGVKIGLGTDCGGGYSGSMLNVMKEAFMVSVARSSETDGKDEALSVSEGFYLATLGGAKVCGLGDRVGNFLVGKEFDALLVRSDVEGIMAVVEEEDSTMDIFEKFLTTGDDRNVVKVFVRGREVKSPSHSPA